MANAVITFGSTDPFGTTGWECQSSSVSVQSSRAVALDNVGNECADDLHSDITNVTASYGPAGSDAPTIPASIGDDGGSYVITSINVTTSATDFAKMTINGHNHTNAAHSGLKAGAHSQSLAAAFGVTDWLGGTAGDNASLESSSITISCEHTDIQGGTGDHLAGENFHGHITATVTWHGVPSAAGGTGFDTVSVETTTDNTGFTKTAITAEKGVDLA